MKSKGNNKKIQNTFEYIMILSAVIAGVIVLLALYMHSWSNIKLGNTDTLLAVAYVTGANGQPICNTSYSESTCFEILLTKPLPPYPVHNATYWNTNSQANPNFEAEQDNYFLELNSPFSDQFYFPFNNSYSSKYGVALDNYGDVYYIGQVNGYYEYIVYAYPAVEQPAFISSLELQYYTPNLNGNLTNATYILPPSGGVLPLEMDLNTTSLTNLVPEQTTQVPKLNDVLTVTEAGLQSGSTLSYTETFPNGTVTSGNFIVPSNSESTFVISNLTNQLPENVTLSLTGITNGVTVGKETLTTSDNDNVFVNFTPPAPIELIATTNTIGPFVVTTNRNEEFSNMVVTTGNTLSNGGSLDDAYITNMTSNHVEFFIKTPANVLYLNFEGTSQLSPNGPTGTSPNLNPNWNYGQYDDGAIVFDEGYTNFITGNPSSGSFGSNTPSTQNDIITNVFSSGPFTFNANGNQTTSFKINNELNLTESQTNGFYFENLYLPIRNGETYILDGWYGNMFNIGMANSTSNFYDYTVSDPMWTNGIFARGACNDIYLETMLNAQSNTACPGENQIIFYNDQFVTTYSLYSLNGNTITITFPDGNIEKQLSAQLNGPYNFTIEIKDSIPIYYLAETNQPVQLELCNNYPAPNTISCSP